MVIPVAELLKSAEKYFRRAVKDSRASVTLTIEGEAEGQVVGDVHQLHFLFENLIDEALSVPASGELRLQASADGKFVRFCFTDTRRGKTQDELNHLFYPNLERMTSGKDGRLQGTEYLICKQIVRDHDEYAGRRGCRINAEPARDGRGFTLYFTVPCK